MTLVFVIIRAYRNKPVRLSAINVKPSYVLVAGEDLTKSIGFPLDHVYQFDAARYEQLREAYEKGDQSRLAALWQNSPLYASTPIKKATPKNRPSGLEGAA